MQVQGTALFIVVAYLIGMLVIGYVVGKLKIKDSKRLLITPHIAWASVEARTHLMEIIHGQVKDFFA